VGRVLADERSRAVVEELLARLQRGTRALLADHRHLVAALRDALLERHELIGHEITDVLEAAQAASGGWVVDVRQVRGEPAGPDA
jgi:hypothetical protein